MIGWLRDFARGQRRMPRAALGGGQLVYAVGDVHGRDDLLADLLDRIEQDRAGRAAESAILVFLGDLIDRGPASAAVIERLRTYRPDGITPWFLAGNHEEVLLRILGGDDSLISDWLRFGGRECLVSYGVTLNRIDRRAGATIRAAIPPEHRDFLGSFHDSLRVGAYLFVHAGIRPGIPLADQDPFDLRWIRRPFLDDARDHGFTVVHGHTVSDQVDVAANRIGIDTGAYRSGELTAFGAMGADQWFLSTKAAAADPV